MQGAYCRQRSGLVSVHLEGLRNYGEVHLSDKLAGYTLVHVSEAKLCGLVVDVES